MKKKVARRPSGTFLNMGCHFCLSKPDLFHGVIIGDSVLRTARTHTHIRTQGNGEDAKKNK